MPSTMIKGSNKLPKVIPINMTVCFSPAMSRCSAVCADQVKILTYSGLCDSFCFPTMWYSIFCIQKEVMLKNASKTFIKRNNQYQTCLWIEKLGKWQIAMVGRPTCMLFNIFHENILPIQFIVSQVHVCLQAI